jgi:hypothetical protein
MIFPIYESDMTSSWPLIIVDRKYCENLKTLKIITILFSFISLSNSYFQDCRLLKTMVFQKEFRSIDNIVLKYIYR